MSVQTAAVSQLKADRTGRSNSIRRVSVLGATGSIGVSTLDLLGRSEGQFEVVALTANTNAVKLAELAKRHRAQTAVIADESQYQTLVDALAGTGIEVGAGAEALTDAAREPADCVVAAIVGAAGLSPTFAAAGQGTRIAIANKECLVSAGDAFMQEITRCGTELLPVDSEHSAAFQSLLAAEPDSIDTITLTASGGPFRTFTKEQLAHVTRAEALAHPTWSMGAKISIDSATMMNKGLELIEAWHLFPVSPHQLKVLIHPQSIVHCLVSYCDGSVLAQMASPDMRTPISLALAWPRRMTTPTKKLDLAEISNLTFETADEDRFPALRLAREAMAKGGSAPAVLNAANEVAVAAFLENRIGFLEIVETVALCCESADKNGLIGPCRALGDVLSVDAEARCLANAIINR
ncbi:MAG: 1-deoxy-D-xylulose-5-phosphate reductoisomerase [Hyphomicrobiaceae bacterium]